MSLAEFRNVAEKIKTKATIQLVQMISQEKGITKDKHLSKVSTINPKNPKKVYTHRIKHPYQEKFRVKANSLPKENTPKNEPL